MKDKGATFDNTEKETKDALSWFSANTYLVNDILYWMPVNSNGRNRSRSYSNNPCGCISKRGYIQIRMGRDKFMAHRIIWALHYGSWPKNGIDHINGIKTDNRIENMREVTQFSNSKNARKYPRKEAWIATGVHRSGNGFVASAQVNKTNAYIGYYRCHTAALIARKLFDIGNGFTDRHGQAIEPILRGE